MTLTEARTRIATLQPGHQLQLDGKPLVVASVEQGVIEAHPDGHADSPGTYWRVSIESLASRLITGTAVLP